MKGSTIVARRVFEGLSQAEFAEALGYSQSSIGFVESGQREPSPRLIAAIARRFPFTDEFLSFFDDYSKINGINHDAILPSNKSNFKRLV